MRCDTTRLVLEILTLLSSFLHTIASIILDRGSEKITNKASDKGSPCLRHLPLLKYPKGSTVYENGEHGGFDAFHN